MESLTEKDYEKILRAELMTAMGCTEPIAIAYAAALARKVLGCVPEKMEVTVSTNILKNAKSVLIPNTDGLKGIAAAAAAGAAGGDPDRKLEVIAGMTEEDRKRVREFLEKAKIQIRPSDSEEKLDIGVHAVSGERTAWVRIARSHTNIVRIEKDGKILEDHPLDAAGGAKDCGEAAELEELKSLLTVEGILDYADYAELDGVRDLLIHQIACNSKISKAGLQEKWGAEIGRTILSQDTSVNGKAAAYAAAGSDARMSGCEMPVVINSGSGNQGITVTMPVLVYAQEEGIEGERLLRALLVSNLISIHIKSRIGALSAFCGAVSAGCGASCGIAYLLGLSRDCIRSTLTNTLAVTSGIFCDGAKPSCAAKIAASVQAGLLALRMAEEGVSFQGGDGIVGADVEDTIRNVGEIGANGMNATDQEIVRIMCD